MKKLLFFILSMLVFTGLAGCNKEKELEAIIDYAGYSYYVWENGSDHEITLSTTNPPGTLHPGSYVFNETLQPGGSFEWEEMGGIAYCYPPSQFYVETFTVAFDGQVEIVYAREGFGPGVFAPADYDPRYDIALDDNYVYEPTSVTDCPECRGARFTYTFTNADYDAAVAYSAAQAGEAENSAGR